MVCLTLIQVFGSLMYQIVGTPAVRVVTDPVVLLGGRHLAGHLLFLVSDALYKSLGILFLIFLARTLLRKQWLAAGVIVIVLAAINAANALNPQSAACVPEWTCQAAYGIGIRNSKLHATRSSRALRDSAVHSRKPVAIEGYMPM